MSALAPPFVSSGNSWAPPRAQPAGQEPPLEPKPAEVDLILYHASCTDGFGAVVAAQHYYKYTRKGKGQAPVAIPLQYDRCDRVTLDFCGKNVAIFDFSLPLPLMERLRREARSYVLWDHHDTARADLENFPNCHFDLEYSGAVLAWRFFYGTQAGVPNLLEYVQDRDLWRNELHCTEEVNKWIWHELGIQDADSWLRAMGLWPDMAETAIAGGGVLVRQERRLVDQLCNAAFQCMFQGERVVMVNSPLLASEVGHELLKRYHEAHAAVMYSEQRSFGERKFSLRSRDHEVHVGQLAKRFGGGGHQAAASFRLHASDPPTAALFTPVV